MEASEGIQPAEGQGADDGGSGLYDLNEVPQELREQLEPHLKAIEGNATRKFQEHADYRRAWEPYEQLGVNQYDPESLQELLQWAEMAQDDNAFAQWFAQVGEQAGLFEQLGYTKDDDLGLDDDLGMEGLSPEQIAEIVRGVVAEEIAPINDQMTEQQRDQVVREAEEDLSTQLSQIREQNPDLPEGAEQAILKLSYSYAEDDAEDPIANGFSDYQQIVGQGEGNLFSKKLGQPTTPQGPGAADTSPERITSFGDPRLKEAARERLERGA